MNNFDKFFYTILGLLFGVYIGANPVIMELDNNKNGVSKKCGGSLEIIK